MNSETPCAMTFLGSGSCQTCGLQLRHQIGQEMRQEHRNEQGAFCASHCSICRGMPQKDADLNRKAAKVDW